MKKESSSSSKQQEDALRVLNTAKMHLNLGDRVPSVTEVNRSSSLADLTGIRIACCSRNFKRAALLFDNITTASTLFERESPGYELVPDWIAASDPLIVEAARDISNRGWSALPDEFDLATFQAVSRDGLLVDIARICRAQGAHAAVLDLTHPEVLEVTAASTPPIGLVAALKMIPVAVENELSWDQVRQFLADAESVRKYRDLHLWLEYGLSAHSEQHALDIIAQKLDDYRWAIKKHGIFTKLEVVTSLLATGALIPSAGGAVAAIAQVDERLAALVGGALAAIGVGAWVAKRAVDLDDIKRGQNREIAYLYEIERSLE